MNMAFSEDNFTDVYLLGLFDGKDKLQIQNLFCQLFLNDQEGVTVTQVNQLRKNLYPKIKKLAILIISF